MAQVDYLRPYAWLLPPQYQTGSLAEYRLPPEVRYIVIDGGRGSGKSFHTSDALMLQALTMPGGILYARYTLVAADQSIIPEFTDKMDRHEVRGYFNVTSQEITSVTTNATIYFRGIHQASKNQVARLKSIPDLRVFVLDEGQELDDESQFDVIDLSLRSVRYQNLIIIIWNPTDVRHWIWRRFFSSRGVAWNFNGIHGDTCYIHTDYTQNVHNLSDSFLTRAERAKLERPAYYRNIFLGEPATQSAGLIYRNWQQIDEDEYPEGLPQWWGNDWGFSDDPDALVRMCYDPVTGTLYVREVMYESGRLARDVARAVLEDASRLVHHYEARKDERGRVVKDREGNPVQDPVPYQPQDCLVYCDPARPEGIAELRRIYSIAAVGAVNRDKSGRIGWLQAFRVKYVGDNIAKEVEEYSWKPDPHDRNHNLDEPQDGNDHCMDAINYGAFTHLHRLGVSL